MTDRQIDIPGDTSPETFQVGGCRFLPTRLEITGALTFEEWHRHGAFIRAVNHGSQWWWGDWMNAGEDKWGDRALQAVEATGWEPETVRGYAWVARQVDPSVRFPEVPFCHYQLLAAKELREQRRWAETCRDEAWSHSKLKRALVQDSAKGDATYYVLVKCADAADQEKMLERFHIEDRGAKAVVRRATL